MGIIQQKYRFAIGDFIGKEVNICHKKIEKKKAA